MSIIIVGEEDFRANEGPEFDIGLRGLELLDHILKIAEAQPETFDMDSWAVRKECGTTMCLAGWAAHLTGARLVYVRNPWADADDPPCAGECEVGGALLPIPFYAAQVLGLPAIVAENMFLPHRNLAELKQMRDECVEEKVFLDV